MDYEPVIGLEVHVELKTKTKMFCDCLNNPDEIHPNKNICPVCLGHPGTLPAINKEAVRKVVLVGLALNSEIPEFSKFDRKNYFYPDLPKGYQISQYDEPLCKGGKLKLFLSDDPQESLKEIDITRVHLEEDAGKLIHPEDKKSTLIDFNRAGVPLMELVTEPVLSSAKEARLFAQGLQILLKTLGVSDTEMEKGQMRCEVNISLREKSETKSPVCAKASAGRQKLGTKVEVKNLNSFKAVEKAIDYEIKRQAGLLERGEAIIQETRGWDSVKEITYPQRSKEEAQDYRYFPEPDLPPLHLYSKTAENGLFDLERLKEQLPELPWVKKQRIKDVFNLSDKETNLFIQDKTALAFFEGTIKELKKYSFQDFNRAISLTLNYLTTDIFGIKDKEGLQWQDVKLTPGNFSLLIANLLTDTISSRTAKDILLEIIYSNQNVEELLRSKKLTKINDIGILNQAIEEIITNNPRAVEDYKKGKENALQFLVGQTMRKLKGAAGPKELEKLIKDKVDKNTQ